MTVSEVEEAKEAEISRAEAMMTDWVEKLKDLTQGHAKPREVLEFCQQWLPKLDDVFRVQMTYVSPDAKPGLQRMYVQVRQEMLDMLVQASRPFAI
jgi:hypothetical protein